MVVAAVAGVPGFLNQIREKLEQRGGFADCHWKRGSLPAASFKGLWTTVEFDVTPGEGGMYRRGGASCRLYKDALEEPPDIGDYMRLNTGPWLVVSGVVNATASGQWVVDLDPLENYGRT